MTELVNPLLIAIPIPTLVPYQVDEMGNAYREGKQIMGWTHYPPKRFGTNPYRRVRVKMANGENQFFYVQRLMGFTFFELTITDDRIMLHGIGGTLDNSLPNLRIGSHYDNNVTDRKANGTYMARGGNNTEDVRAIEAIASELKTIEPGF